MAKNGESVDIHVTEVFGFTVMRKYVKTVGKGEKINDGDNQRLHLLRAIPIVMILSSIFCIGGMVAILYNPPPLVEEVANRILDFAKCNTLEFEERIKVLEEENKRLKTEASENFTREEQLRAKFLNAEEANVALSKRLSSANDSIKSLKAADAEKQRKINDLEQDFKICMDEKTDLKKQESNVKDDLENCTSNAKQLNYNIAQLQNKASEALKKADESIAELEEDLQKCQANSSSIHAQKENIDKNLTTTTKELTEYKFKETELKTNIAKLTRNLSESQDSLKVLNEKLQESEKENKHLMKKKNNLEKDLKATRFNLGQCKNKNMDHEVANLELLQKIEGLEKELKAC